MKAGSSAIVEVGGKTDMAMLAVIEDTTDIEVADGKTVLLDSKKPAERLLLVRRVLPESRSLLHKQQKGERSRRKTRRMLKIAKLPKFHLATSILLVLLSLF